MENEQLVARIRAGEDTAENTLELYDRNRGIIARIAKRYQGMAEMEDLMQEGYIGLSEAVDHYDMDQGVPFINYAAFWIRQDMSRYIDNCGSVIRLPVYARNEIHEYNRVVREFREQYGEHPPDIALRRFMKVSRERLEEIKKNARMGQIRSLSEEIGGDDAGLRLEDVIASDQDLEGDVIREVDTAALKRELWVAVDRLPGELPEVIRRRYIYRQTQKEIGRILGVKASRVGAIQAQALGILRRPGISKKYRKYYEEYLAAAHYHHVGVEAFQRTWMSEVELEILRRMGTESRTL